MLTELFIKNFAIIDDLRISFDQGLSVLSGETGAGKSILINAVNLLLGSRASAKLIRTGCESAELEALFQVGEKSNVAGIMKELDMDPAEGLIIRRIISSSNKHKIYINGRLATIQTLTRLTENLASISGQHAHQGLLKEELHLTILDQFGKLMPLRQKVEDGYRKIVPLLKKLDQFKEKEKRKNEQTELLLFQQKEIEDAELEPGEDDELEIEITRLRNSETILQTLHMGAGELYSSSGSVTEVISVVKKELEKTEKLDPAIAEQTEKLSDIIYQIEDISSWLEGHAEEISMDEARLSEAENRMNTIRTLKRKYGATIEEILDHYQQISGELEAMDSLSTEIRDMTKLLAKEHESLCILCLKLSDEREKAAEKLSASVEKELASLSMPNTRFKVDITRLNAQQSSSGFLAAEGSQITESGINMAEFMLAPNVGEDMKPLAKTASGGELSRVVLALKAILAKSDSVETVVFDEVDTGIGGSVAEMVGQKIAELSRYHQVICITHLPQIAKFGKHHYKIEKGVKDGRTRTTINRLSRDMRVEEMARMLGGIEITQATMDHAREMLDDQ